MFEKFWWTWSGSNRRPLPCHLRNINHLQTLPPETKDLARCLVDAGGRHGTPFGHLDSTWTPGLHARNGTLRALTRAVASHCDCCLLETTTICFHIKDVARVEVAANRGRYDTSMARRFIGIPEWVEESMFTPLRRTDRVFQLDPRGARTNRSLFVSHDPEYVCAHGYRLAARLAVEHIRHDGVDSPFLVYPIVFLYRHHIELMLKRLIRRADETGVRYYLQSCFRTNPPERVRYKRQQDPGGTHQDVPFPEAEVLGKSGLRQPRLPSLEDAAIRGADGSHQQLRRLGEVGRVSLARGGGVNLVRYRPAVAPTGEVVRIPPASLRRCGRNRVRTAFGPIEEHAAPVRRPIHLEALAI